MDRDELDIIISHEWLVRSIAKKFYGASYNDLLKAGRVGLIMAYRKFDSDGVTKFSSYATKYVYGEMYKLVLNSKNIKIGRDILNLYKQIEHARDFLTQKLERNPSITELSMFTEIEEDMIALTIESAIEMLSLDDTLKDGEEDYYAVLGKDENYDDKIVLNDSINLLSKEEQEIIRKRYFGDLTQSEVAKSMNMTQVMVSRLEKKSLHKMHEYIAA